MYMKFYKFWSLYSCISLHCTNKWYNRYLYALKWCMCALSLSL